MIRQTSPAKSSDSRARQDTNVICEVCCNPQDQTDSLFTPCKCGYQICLWCFHQIRNDTNSCPKCRRPYTRQLPKQATTLTSKSFQSNTRPKKRREKKTKQSPATVNKTPKSTKAGNKTPRRHTPTKPLDLTVRVDGSKKGNKKRYDFYMFQYKCKPCGRQRCQQKVFCPGFHHQGERRRNPNNFKYGYEPCPAVKENQKWKDAGRCKKGDSCDKAHTLLEQMYHPLIYKTSLCANFPKKQCSWGEFCTHAHGEEDKRAASTVCKTIKQSSPKNVSRGVPSQSKLVRAKSAPRASKSRKARVRSPTKCSKTPTGSKIRIVKPILSPWGSPKPKDGIPPPPPTKHAWGKPGRGSLSRTNSPQTPTPSVDRLPNFTPAHSAPVCRGEISAFARSSSPESSFAPQPVSPIGSFNGDSASNSGRFEDVFQGVSGPKWGLMDGFFNDDNSSPGTVELSSIQEQDTFTNNLSLEFEPAPLLKIDNGSSAPHSLLGSFNSLASTVPKARSSLTVCTDESIAGSVTSDAQTYQSAYDRLSFRGERSLHSDLRMQKRMEGLESENTALLKRVRELENLVQALLKEKNVQNTEGPPGFQTPVPYTSGF